MRLCAVATCLIAHAVIGMVDDMMGGEQNVKTYTMRCEFGRVWLLSSPTADKARHGVGMSVPEATGCGSRASMP